MAYTGNGMLIIRKALAVLWVFVLYAGGTYVIANILYLLAEYFLVGDFGERVALFARFIAYLGSPLMGLYMAATRGMARVDKM